MKTITFSPHSNTYDYLNLKSPIPVSVLINGHLRKESNAHDLYNMVINMWASNSLPRSNDGDTHANIQ